MSKKRRERVSREYSDLLESEDISRFGSVLTELFHITNLIIENNG